MRRIVSFACILALLVGVSGCGVMDNITGKSKLKEQNARLQQQQAEQERQAQASHTNRGSENPEGDTTSKFAFHLGMPYNVDSTSVTCTLPAYIDPAAIADRMIEKVGGIPAFREFLNTSTAPVYIEREIELWSGQSFEARQAGTSSVHFMIAVDASAVDTSMHGEIPVIMRGFQSYGHLLTKYFDLKYTGQVVFQKTGSASNNRFADPRSRRSSSESGMSWMDGILFCGPGNFIPDRQGTWTGPDLGPSVMTEQACYDRDHPVQEPDRSAPRAYLKKKHGGGTKAPAAAKHPSGKPAGKAPAAKPAPTTPSGSVDSLRVDIHVWDHSVPDTTPQPPAGARHGKRAVWSDDCRGNWTNPNR